MGKIKDIDELKRIFIEIQEICKKDMERERDENPQEIPYWRCQAYVRTLPSEQNKSDEIKKKLSEFDDTNSSIIKSQVDEMSKRIEAEEEQNEKDKDTAKKLIKLLDRKRRKFERIEKKQKFIEKLKEENREKSNIMKVRYVICKSCKNPKSGNCQFELCRKCCKEKVFTEELECKGFLSLFIIMIISFILIIYFILN
jgi:hypothetical protein